MGGGIAGAESTLARRKHDAHHGTWPRSARPPGPSGGLRSGMGILGIPEVLAHPQIAGRGFLVFGPNRVTQFGTVAASHSLGEAVGPLRVQNHALSHIYLKYT